ncbi:MAG: hypothetical protein JNK85_03395 [Verrucomicrobiales bacterium]|nr:hypothetical protein [Verrucomicrobiales bacterium]
MLRRRSGAAGAARTMLPTGQGGHRDAVVGVAMANIGGKGRIANRYQFE